MLGTLQDEQARLKAEYDRMEVCKQDVCALLLFAIPFSDSLGLIWNVSAG